MNTPYRICIGCKSKLPKSQLFRFTLSLQVDAAGQKQPGRGAYVCQNEACIAKAISAKPISRTLKASVENRAEQLETLLCQLRKKLA
jgi:hypothetical protein